MVITYPLFKLWHQPTKGCCGQHPSPLKIKTPINFKLWAFEKFVKNLKICPTFVCMIGNNHDR